MTILGGAVGFGIAAWVSIANHVDPSVAFLLSFGLSYLGMQIGKALK